MGTIGLIAWLVTPAVFVLVVAIVAIGLYARSITLGVSWSKCFLRRPTLIIGFWAVVAAVDAYWIFVLGQQPSGRLTGPGPSATLRRLRRGTAGHASGRLAASPAREPRTPGLGR